MEQSDEITALRKIMNGRKLRKETELIERMKVLLVKKGFKIYPQEVNSIKLLAQDRSGLTYSFEVKNNINFVISGLGQALRNHLYTHLSYVVIPKRSAGKIDQDTLHLIKELKLGLIQINEDDYEEIINSERKEPKDLILFREWEK